MSTIIVVTTWKVSFEWQGLHDEWHEAELEVEGEYFAQAAERAFASIIGEEMPPETRAIRNLEIRAKS